MIGKGTPRGSKSVFTLIYWINLDLIVAREPIHKGKYLMAGTVIDNLVDERGCKVVFRESMVDIMKFSGDAKALLINWVGCH